MEMIKLAAKKRRKGRSRSPKRQEEVTWYDPLIVDATPRNMGEQRHMAGSTLKGMGAGALAGGLGGAALGAGAGVFPGAVIGAGLGAMVGNYQGTKKVLKGRSRRGEALMTGDDFKEQYRRNNNSANAAMIASSIDRSHSRR